jgi:tetratricopeptide (TPR) repeat protein
MPHGLRKPFLLALYERFLEDQDSAALVDEIARYYHQGTLERLAQHDQAPVRRAAVFALGYLGDYGCNASLGAALQDEDRSVRLLAESAIRNVWTRIGDEDERRHLKLLVRLNSSKLFHDAIRKANDLLKRSAWLAEAWNQRAIAHFSLGHFADSIRDCHQALEINPYHFGAASGMGQAYLQLGNHLSALESFRRALRLNPNLEAVRVQVARLTRLIEEK